MKQILFSLAVPTAGITIQHGKNSTMSSMAKSLDLSSVVQDPRQQMAKRASIEGRAACHSPLLFSYLAAAAYGPVEGDYSQYHGAEGANHYLKKFKLSPDWKAIDAFTYRGNPYDGSRAGANDNQWQVVLIQHNVSNSIANIEECPLNHGVVKDGALDYVVAFEGTVVQSFTDWETDVSADLGTIIFYRNSMKNIYFLFVCSDSKAYVGCGEGPIISMDEGF